jgi:hypothetical protein
MPGARPGQSLRRRLRHRSLSEDLIEQAVTATVARTHQRELHWWSSGWHGYRSMLVRAYRQRVWTGKCGRPPLVVPETVTLTQTVKHRDEHGRLLSIEIRAALGAGIEPAGTVHVERPGGALRDRLNALTRKTHVFAKRDASFRCARGFAALRSQLPSSSSSEAAASGGRCASLFPALSGHGSRVDGSSLVVSRRVNAMCKF